MKHNETLVKLYYLLVGSKEIAGKREIEMGRRMAFHEGLDQHTFQQRLDDLNGEDFLLIYKDCLNDLRQMSQHLCLRCLAWMILIANADGFMEESEWQLIYKLYHKELGVSLSDLMREQRQLNILIKNHQDQKIVL